MGHAMHLISPVCPPGMPVAMCSNDPCENAVCHGHEHAACVQNYCGGCSAVFYDSYGRKLHCNGKNAKLSKQFFDVINDRSD